ncbi:DUF2199 domain-containing protein [Hymenobacter sublimis]|uniref:DUF2199 domain-containing protein n=1 Tax=Hymenobacter sublimis TaxID=2933777 RepID=A0ABY4J9K7_9BACT|nr:DUF2199 domain-containing protein [Hymenobacter sublimis]UPL49490.1 DUF2199 domain-containing protein [Hymenobacter sublimis]
MSYVCACCGETHEYLPDIGFAKPENYFDVPPEQRDTRVQVTADTCIIDNQYFYIRGVIKIPLHDSESYFGIGAWISQKEENFWTYQQHPNTDEIGPYFGWLCSDIPEFGETLSLKTQARFQCGNLRPWIELEPTNHPLSVAQHEGISADKAWEIVHEYLPK